MKGWSASFVQFLKAFGLAHIFFFAEYAVQTNVISRFITEQGILAIAALVALNASAVIYLVTRLLSLEQQLECPYGFDEVKAEAWHAMREQLLVMALFYFTLSVTPEQCWDITKFPCMDCLTLSAVPCIIARAFLFQAFYATYDVAKATVRGSMNPRNS